MGCGEGRLLKLLQDENNCSILGIELDEDRFLESVDNGVPILRADLDEGLSGVPDAAFDFAVLSQTLQQVRHPLDLLDEILRVASKVIVVVPNFGHWKVRLQVLLQGRAPVTDELPYQWYNSPNLHFMSMHDFSRFSQSRQFPYCEGITIDWRTKCTENLRSESESTKYSLCYGKEKHHHK